MKYQHFWPPNDIYFGGVASVIDEMSLITNERNYLFVNLNQYSLRSTLVFSHVIKISIKL